MARVAGIVLVASTLGAMPADAATKKNPLMCRVIPAAQVVTTYRTGPAGSIEIDGTLTEAPASCGTQAVKVSGKVAVRVGLPSSSARRGGRGTVRSA